VLVEERLVLESEVAQVVVRAVDGSPLYPLVTTVQSNGMCVEVRYPADVDPGDSPTRPAASAKDRQPDRRVGVLAIEFFVSDRGAGRQRGRAATPQLGPLDDRGRAHEPVHQPPARGERTAPG
jgi:hypothetical protein